MIVPKYNPARTFTYGGAVGIGGQFMAIYGMDSPGGYQLFGRTLPIWDTFGGLVKKKFANGNFGDGFFFVRNGNLYSLFFLNLK